MGGVRTCVREAWLKGVKGLPAIARLTPLPYLTLTLTVTLTLRHSLTVLSASPLLLKGMFPLPRGAGIQLRKTTY